MFNSLIRRTSEVAIATALGQGLVLFVTPILARHYSPQQFGELALLMTMSNFCVAAACLRYDLALPAVAERESRGLLLTALGLSGIIAGLTTVVLLTYSAVRGIPFGGGILQHPVLMGACVLLVGCYQATNGWFIRLGEFRRVALMRLSQGIGFSGLAMIPGVGLLWSHVLSFSLGIWGVTHALRGGKRSDEPWFSAAKRHRNFPLISLPGALLDVCGYSICIWVIVNYYGKGVAGNYSQIQRLTGAPLMLVSISLGQTLLKATADLSHDQPALRRFLSRVLQIMLLLSACGLFALWCIGRPVIEAMLGPQWSVSRRIIILVALAVFARACISPLSSVLVTLRRFGSALTWQVLYFSSALLLLPLVARHVPFVSYILFYAVHECFFYSLYLVIIYRAVRAGPARENTALAHAAETEIAEGRTVSGPLP